MVKERLKGALLLLYGGVLGLALGAVVFGVLPRSYEDVLASQNLFASVAIAMSLLSLGIALKAMAKVTSTGRMDRRPPACGSDPSWQSGDVPVRNPVVQRHEESQMRQPYSPKTSLEPDGYERRRPSGLGGAGLSNPMDSEPRLTIERPPQEARQPLEEAQPEATIDWYGGARFASISESSEEEPEIADWEDPLEASSSGLTEGPSPERLVQVWEAYLAHGDGRFNVAGMRKQLDAAGIRATVTPGPELGLTDSVIGVSGESGSKIFLFPNFTRPVQAVAQWYADVDAYPRGAAVSGVVEVAVAERVGGRIELRKQGRLA